MQFQIHLNGDVCISKYVKRHGLNFKLKNLTLEFAFEINIICKMTDFSLKDQIC